MTGYKKSRRLRGGDMKLSNKSLLLASILFAVSCGAPNSEKDIMDSSEPDVIYDVIQDATDTLEVVVDSDVATDADGRIEDTVTDEGITTLDVPLEIPDVCACRSNEDCADTFEDLSVCEKAECSECACIRLFKDDEESCDDDNVCTENDKCLDATCVGGANICSCTTDEDCAVHDNGNLCDGSFKCSLTVTPPVCEIDPASISVCEDTQDHPCRTVGCDPATGACIDVFINENGFCDDAVDCTIDDKCISGVCIGTTMDSLCNDGDACTDNSCDSASGCVYINNEGTCEDGNLCTQNDSCLNGNCIPGSAVVCFDNNDCTSEECVPGTGCVYTNLEIDCNDDDACTGQDSCLEGTCNGSNEICCNDETDNDNDGNTDCDDADCIDSSDCPVLDVSCMMMAPGVFSGSTGDSFTANVMIGAAGVTTLTFGFDAHPQIRVQYAVGPANTAAVDLGSLSWTSASPDPATAHLTFDYWTGNIVVPAITDSSLSRDFMFRASGDKGTTWTYCDKDGSANGYAPEQSGKLSITPPYKLMFSEYMEGTGYYKALEIYNAGQFPAYLGNCSVLIYANGMTTTSNSTILNNIDVAPGGVFTVCSDSILPAAAELCDLQTVKINYNGDDAVALICSGVVQDVIGVIGTRPTSGGWGSEDVSTKDRTIRRSCLVQSGTGAAPQVFADGEWIGLAVDTWIGLGSRLCSGDCVDNEGETCCEDSIDSDLDGLTDCDDSDCKTAVACQIPVDWCQFAEPVLIRGSAGMSIETSGWVFVAGMTDMTTDNDNPPGIVAQFGYGPDATIPDLSWTWSAAHVNSSNTSPLDYADTYSSDFVVPNIPEDSYDTAFRFSADGGYSWTYCDTDGLDDGYTAAQAGSLEVVFSPNMLFSEYVSGTGNDKALEIINFSGRSVDLGYCDITIYADGALGSSASFPIAHGVMLAADQTYVICKTGASGDLSPYCDMFKSLLDFNGNDTVTLTCEDKLMDVFGRRGENPGENGWGTEDITSAAHTLRRHCDVLTGDIDTSNAFNPAIEWWGFPVNTIEGLGTVLCGSLCYENGMEICCDDTEDNDLDGLTDCMDPDCVDAPECEIPVVEYAALEQPHILTFLFGATSNTINARVFVPGVTGFVGQGAGVRAEAGYGADGSIPDSTTWTWVSATYTTDLDTSDDRYSATLTGVPVGTWDYAFRFSTDNGITWVYADKEINGNTDGYSPADAGSMTVNASVETVCDDDIDNDGDLQKDCFDDDCVLEPYCQAETVCDDTIDNDGDLLTDCNDPDCVADLACIPLPALIFSEYLEGSLFNKFVEIQNFGTETISLTGCQILIYYNGNMEPDTARVTLTGDLTAGDVLVVCNNQFSVDHIANCDTLSSALGFNGNDSVVLACDGRIIDSIGKVSESLTTGWVASPGGWDTKDEGLCRSVLTQDTIIDDEFNPAIQWDAYGNDYFAGMGITGCDPV